MFDNDVRSKIRSQIEPFPRVATYPTSWAGALTFQQLYDDLAHYVTNVMKGKGIHRTNYLTDCIQHGFMALWLELVENNNFLNDKTRQQAVFFIMARCKISTLRYYDDKFDSLEELMSYDWRNTWDEHTITCRYLNHFSPDRRFILHYKGVKKYPYRIKWHETEEYKGEQQALNLATNSTSPQSYRQVCQRLSRKTHPVLWVGRSRS